MNKPERKISDTRSVNVKDALIVSSLDSIEAFKKLLKNNDDSFDKEKIETEINTNNNGRFKYIGRFKKRGCLYVFSV